MVWAAFSGKRGKLNLHVMVRDLESKRYRYSANSYLEVLKENIPNVYSRDMLFMQDNARIYTAKKVIYWFGVRDITVINQLACSPDLNLIEHVQFYLKAKVLELYPQLNRESSSVEYI